MDKLVHLPSLFGKKSARRCVEVGLDDFAGWWCRTCSSSVTYMKNLLSLRYLSDHFAGRRERDRCVLQGCSSPGVCCLLLNLHPENTRECLTALADI